MSFLHAKANYVRPHAKASFIRPLCDNSETEPTHKEPIDYYDEFKGMKSPVRRSDSMCKLDNLKAIGDSKEKHFENWNSAHSKLFAEIKNVQSWATSVESDTKQKSKKLDDLTQRVESQRKIVLELQMQNENLSIQLSKEIQQRISVLEKFYFTKELFSTLRKKFQDLQSQLDACHKMKKAVDAHCLKITNNIQELSNKFSTMRKEYTGKILILNNDLRNEKHNNAALKELCEQQNLTAKKEHEVHCKLIENYQEELKNYSEDLKSEKSKILNLKQEKDILFQRVSELEKNNEACVKKLNDTEEQLKIEVESKLETEKRYESENAKVNNLIKKCEELEELRNKQKIKFEENCVMYETKINSLEKSICELKQKLVDCENESENLKVALKERENEKCALEMEVLAITKENIELKDKSVIDAKISDEIISNLMKEKNDLTASSSLVEKELKLTSSNNEILSKTCTEKDTKLSQLAEELKVATSKIEELSFVEKEYNEAMQKLEKMEADTQLNLDILTSKEQKIEELLELKSKYDESLQKIKDLEESFNSKSKQLQSKEHEIEELLEIKFKYDECLQKIKDFEDSLNSKSKQLQLKDDKIKELDCIEEKYVAALNNIREMEKEVLSKNELLISKEQKIEELSNVEKTYAAALEKIEKLEGDVKYHMSLLDEKEVLIADLNTRLNNKSIECDKLEYENFEMKDNLEKERESVQICLECEIMKDKMQNVNLLKSTLEDTERKLISQRQQTNNVLKMLHETEENFDGMRLKKEKEIIKYKDTIQSLQHELKILKVEANEAAKLKSEINKLQLKIEELTLQNSGDCQRLKIEIEKLKIENEALITGKNLSASDVKAILKNQLEVDTSKKKHKLYVENKKVEADSSHEALIVEEDTKHKSTPVTSTPVMKTCKLGYEKDTKHKSTPILSTPVTKTCKLANEKITSKRESQSTPLVSEKRKRVWETESSGSECLEIVFDKGAKKMMGITPKNKTPVNTVFPGTPIQLLNKRQWTPSQDKKRDMLEMIDEEIQETKTVISFSTKASPMNWRSAKANENVDFLNSKRNITEVNRSPWVEQNAELKRTPSTPADRKFFKTPLKEREPFKKPDLENLWL